MKNPYSDKSGNIIDFYRIFSIPYDADQEAIRNAFRNLVKLYHPDIRGPQSSADIGKIDLIIKGYKILIDEVTRQDYDRQLFHSKNLTREGLSIVSRQRIRYSSSLKDIVKSRLLTPRMRHRDRIFNFGQDVEIYLTREEAQKGAVAYVALPARTYCPLCTGQNPDCYACKGVGRISTVSHLEVRMTPPVESGRVIDIDLMEARPDRFTSFTMKSLKIKIMILEKGAGAG